MPLLQGLAERLLEKESLDGAEVIAMVKAYEEGRPFPESRPAAVSTNPPAGGAAVPKEKPREAEEQTAGPSPTPQTSPPQRRGRGRSGAGNCGGVTTPLEHSRGLHFAPA